MALIAEQLTAELLDKRSWLVGVEVGEWRQRAFGQREASELQSVAVVFEVQLDEITCGIWVGFRVEIKRN
jgi:hypothetical protein